ncbi:OOP family OmpA-OmpF porin [Paraburkholderia sp. GAS33]|uniref:OmpA family protein n=1 Tax=Paraburkholderia sp. GAS33 TaxID=3035130 RepID=UPI003D1EB98D
MKKTTRYLPVIVLCSALLAGCGMTPTVGANGAVGFPERSSAWLKEGTFVNVDNLRQVGPGLTKNQVYALLQEPHFSEGVFGVHVWNYIFNFRTGHGQDVVTCQYQVQFDDQYRVKATYWKDPACADLIAPTQQETASTPDDQAVPGKFTLDFGVLFPFGKSSLQDLLPAGRTALDNIATSLAGKYRNVKSLRITGYTDRIGADAYNDQLSLARAQTVRDYLIERGIPGVSISVAGLGKSDPVTVNCPPGKGPAAIRCLSHDRRVTIEAFGEKR